jgi:AP-3 complex subunit sigma
MVRNERASLTARCSTLASPRFVVDGAESELGILDLIQVFVESLDRTFENVCELDLIFHFDEVHLVLAEIIQGGLVLETNLSEIASCGE